ncbi:MAG: type III restriction enzyme res subunit [Spirochaetes bacterium]|nr:MAG: type III restriction enzyme res subunit [Spirochaetota bacterium]
MIERIVNTIAGRLSLREPQRKSLEILSRITELVKPSKETDPDVALKIIQSEFPHVTGFDRDFVSLCFALATGVGKTRLMGAFISYLHLAHKVNHFFVLAPNLTIYNKLIADFTAGTAKYVFKGIAEFAQDPPQIITGDNYERADVARSGILIEGGIQINIFNISKINSEVRGGKSPRIKRLSEYIGESYFEYLAALPDLVLLMDESHRYRASAGVKAINELKPILGLELTATPFVESGTKRITFQNVLYHYPLAQAMADGFVKEPAVVTQKNFHPDQVSPEALEKIKLEDGIRVHENTKVHLETWARQNDKPIVKPFMLVVSKDTTHADQLQKFLESADFFSGRYTGKVIQVHSNQSGEEKEEVIQRLLAVESPDEPTEIVVHVNMLKEGWDVTNLYTIVPLRAANARTLVEQSLGRGLRLPYGKRTGDQAVDTLHIIAHDSFQAIVDEANRGDSVLKFRAIELEPHKPGEQLKTVVTNSKVEESLKQGSPAEQKMKELIYTVITEKKELKSSQDLYKTEVKAAIVAEAKARFGTPQAELEGMETIPETSALVDSVITNLVEGTIDIPRIIVLPREGSTVSFRPFTLDLRSLRYQPVSRDLLMQFLRTNEQRTFSFSKVGVKEARLEDYLVRGLIDEPDISYDDHAELLYELAGQVVTHLRSYLSVEEEVRNVLQYHQTDLVAFIAAQMRTHRSVSDTGFEVKVSRGFTPLKKSAVIVEMGFESVDYRRSDFDKSKIGRILFTGYQRCLYPAVKFNSDTERRFSAILERDAEKWFKPAKGQFQIVYQDGHQHSEYIPDFVAETRHVIYMAETKARNEIADPVIIAKKQAAEEWCGHASEYNKSLGKKPWRYLLVPHDQVQDNMSLAAFEQA